MNETREPETMNALINAFVRHPNSVGESYAEHAAFAGRFGAMLMLAGLAALVHALLPFAFERTASGIVKQLHERHNGRGG